MKMVTLTPAITEKLKASFGDADLSNIVVFEAILANGLPIRHAGGLYAGARISEGTMALMADFVGRESVPVILNHITDGEAKGRLFAGAVKDGALHGLFALNRLTDAATVERLNSGISDQVSVSFLSEHAFCSECQFDYFSPEATLDNMYYLECDKGHAIGENGVHVRLTGLKHFYELSVVGQGAVPGAKVIDKKKSAFVQGDDLRRLAAKNIHPAMVVLSASPTLKEIEMDIAPLLAQLETRAVEINTANLAVTALTGERDTARTELAAAMERITTLEAAQSSDVAALQARVAELEPLAAAAEKAPKAEDMSAALACLSTIARRVLIATGNPNPDASIGSDVSALVSLITEKSEALAASVIAGGAVRATSAAETIKTPTATAAFKTRK